MRLNMNISILNTVIYTDTFRKTFPQLKEFYVKADQYKKTCCGNNKKRAIVLQECATYMNSNNLKFKGQSVLEISNASKLKWDTITLQRALLVDKIAEFLRDLFPEEIKNRPRCSRCVVGNLMYY